MDQDLRANIRYICVTGSRGYGLSTVYSDWDRRGFYVAPTNTILGLKSPPEQLEINSNGQDETYYEIGKFISLALKASPNMLEILWTDLVETTSPEAELLRKQRNIFVSRRVKNTHLGWANQQLKRFEEYKRNNNGEINWKNVMHTVRILESLRHLYVFKYPLVNVYKDKFHSPGELAYDLRGIRNHEWSIDAALARTNHLKNILTDLEQHSELPDEPDFASANDILLDIRYSQMHKDGILQYQLHGNEN